MKRAFCGRCGGSKPGKECDTCDQRTCESCSQKLGSELLFCEFCGTRGKKQRSSEEAEEEKERQEERALSQFTKEQKEKVKKREYVSLKHFQAIQPGDEVTEHIFTVEGNSRLVSKEAAHKQPSIETEEAFWAALLHFIKVESYLIPKLAQSNLEALSLFRSWRTPWRCTMNYIERVRHQRSGREDSLAILDTVVFFAECVVPYNP